MLVDSHCHLDYLERDGDLDEVVARARRAGVGAMITICTKLSEFDSVRAIAERYDEVTCSVGVHPHEAEDEGQKDARRLVALTEHPKVVAIGETGLDYYYDHAPRERQRASFRAHLLAARESGLPVIVHSREADDDTVALLREAREEGPFVGFYGLLLRGSVIGHERSLILVKAPQSNGMEGRESRLDFAFFGAPPQSQIRGQVLNWHLDSSAKPPRVQGCPHIVLDRIPDAGAVGNLASPERERRARLAWNG